MIILRCSDDSLDRPSWPGAIRPLQQSLAHCCLSCNNFEQRSPSDLQKNTRRVFDQLLDMLEKRDSFPAVDDPMIIGQRDVHHWPGDDLAAAHDGPVFYNMKTENATLRWIDNWRR